MMNPDRLYYPTEIADEIGMSRNRIGALKKKGCKFIGLKTKIRWVNEFLEEQAKPIETAHP
jgi:hypothetical protein